LACEILKCDVEIGPRRLENNSSGSCIKMGSANACLCDRLAEFIGENNKDIYSLLVHIHGPFVKK
jgi:hypothetical protein